MHIISSVGPSVGYDHGSPVSDRYRGHFPFEGTLDKVPSIAAAGPRRHRCGGRDPDERAAMSRQ